MPPAIEVRDLTRSFGQKMILKGLSLAVPEGCVFGFLGNNGAGKTTTIALLTGILRPSAGEIRLSGQQMTVENEDVRRSLGIVYDSLNLFENLTAREHILFSAGLYGLEAHQARLRCEELLEMLGLKDAADSRIRDYSHGMRKKTALACAMVHDPKIMFLDEPFEGMDVGSTAVVIENLQRLGRMGRTIFVTSHILPLVERFCDEVAILHAGKNVYQGLVKPVDGQPGERLEEKFMRLTNSTDKGAALSWTR